jgi:hypothetical protein
MKKWTGSLEQLITERSDEEINSYSTYSGGSWFKARPGNQLSHPKYFIVLSPPNQMQIQ